MNKKAGFFMVGFFVIILIIFSYALYLNYTLLSGSIEEQNVGNNQVPLLNAYRDGEDALFYLDQSVRHTAYNSFVKLAQKGGLLEYACGRHKNYNLWFNDEGGTKKPCYPKDADLKKNLQKIFLNNLPDYLEEYSPDLRNNYQVELTNEFELIGVAENTIKIDIKDKTGRLVIGDYTIDPNFKQKLNIDFTDYRNLQNIVVEGVKLCNTAVCFENNIDWGSYIPNPRDSGKYVLFDVSTNKEFLGEEIIIKFAVSKTIV